MTPLHAHAQYICIVYAKYQKASVIWRLFHAKNPDLQTMYTSIVNVYFFKYSHVNMLIRIVGW